MNRLSCQYIKKDGSIYKKGCQHKLKYTRYYKAHFKKIYPIYNELTYSDTGICSIYNKIYDRAQCESKKTKTESIPLGLFDIIKILS